MVLALTSLRETLCLWGQESTRKLLQILLVRTCYRTTKIRGILLQKNLVQRARGSPRVNILMRVRIRGPNGQATISLPDKATIGDLRSQIEEKTSIANFEVKYGYPPRPLLLENHQDSAKLSETGLKLDGEQLIVGESIRSTVKHAPSAKETPKTQETSSSAPPSDGTASPQSSEKTSSFSFAGVGKAPTPPAQERSKPLSLTRKPTNQSLDPPELPMPSHSATMVLRIMPDDNSCLFRAFNLAFLGGMDNMHELRSVIAQSIQANTETYSAVVLNKEPDAYCRWIQTQDAWGGAIEMNILSQHFDVEICSIDVQTLRVDRFNEGRPMRCILVYSGIHYDTIALSPSDAPHTHSYNPPDFDTKIFDAADHVVLDTAVELCKILKERRYYTDTASFGIKCNVCAESFVGEKGATEHAAQTGHYDFGEVDG